MLSPIVNFNTGAPIQIVDGKDISLSGQGNDRPNVVLPNQISGIPQSSLAPYWFNPAAFQCAGSNAACSSLAANLATWAATPSTALE